MFGISYGTNSELDRGVWDNIVIIPCKLAGMRIIKIY